MFYTVQCKELYSLQLQMMRLGVNIDLFYI